MTSSPGLASSAWAADAPAEALVGAERHDRSFRVTWQGGESADFHFLWLRDNCGCGDCRHPQTFERTFDVLGVPEDLAPDQVAVVDGALRVIWADDGHASSYDAQWLRAHRYGEHPRARLGIDPWQLWDAASGLPPVFDFGDVMADDRACLSWLEALGHLGLALLKGLPRGPDEVTRVARRVAYPQETNFGAQWEVISLPRPNSNAYTALALNCHTDLPNWESPPGIQFLHCLDNAATGGESVFVDGFKVAEELRRHAPDAFDLLASVPLTYRFHDDTVDIRHRAPAIRLDEAGAVTQVRFSIAVMGVIDAPGPLMEALYRAHRKFAALIREPRFEVRFMLEPGDVVAFDNHRVLHGRTAFDPQSGPRRLQGCYVSRDGLFSRIRVLRRETG
jgi:gamma-butyrobetaine dioxygenase